MCAAAQLPSCYDRSGRLSKNECASQSRLAIRQGHFCTELQIVLLTVRYAYSQHREFENGQHLNIETRIPQYMRQFVGLDSVVSIATVRGSNPGGDEIFLTRPDRPWGPPSLLHNAYRVFAWG